MPPRRRRRRVAMLTKTYPCNMDVSGIAKEIQEALVSELTVKIPELRQTVRPVQLAYARVTASGAISIDVMFTPLARDAYIERAVSATREFLYANERAWKGYRMALFLRHRRWTHPLKVSAYLRAPMLVGMVTQDADNWADVEITGAVVYDPLFGEIHEEIARAATDPHTYMLKLREGDAGSVLLEVAQTVDGSLGDLARAHAGSAGEIPVLCFRAGRWFYGAAHTRAAAAPLPAPTLFMGEVAETLSVA